MTADEIGAFREAVARLCADRFDRTPVRESGGDEQLDLEAWRALGEIGVIGMLAPESHGGMDLGVAAAAEVWEELGHGMAPGPLTWSALAAAHVEGTASGEVVCTGCTSGGSTTLIEHADVAAHVIVVGDQVTIHRAAEMELAPVASVDPFTPLAELRAAGDGHAIGDQDSARRWSLVGACLSAAYLVGLSQLAVETAVAHAKDRVQFGRPVGGFQAVKHLLADSVTNTELARAAVWGAAHALDADAADAERAVAAAKVVAVGAAQTSTRNCIQVHGGMGYTWEADPHLIWKRSMVWGLSFGDGRAHAAALAAGLGRTAVAA